MSMRVGVLTKGEVGALEWAQRLGFRSIEWVNFVESGCGPAVADWKAHAEHLAAEAKARDIRISAIGALYENPLDPRQSDRARSVFLRAIEVAGHIGVRTVAGFAGAVIETEIHPRGGHPIYKPFENFIPQLLAFWEPIARHAADHGVRIAFEHCPQGPFHLPLMHYNMLATPAMWERLFEATRCENLGLEWDASHLICQFIDPVQTIRKFGARIFHVHAKDASIDRELLRAYGPCHPGVAEHRMPGLGDADWGEIIRALLLAGYDSDLNIEGWHDPVYRDHVPGAKKSLGGLEGKMLEETGLLIAKRALEPYVAGTE